MTLRIVNIETDIAIIGGGTAGCFAGITISDESKDASILIIDKANIERSGCLAAGVNAINAYIVEGKTPEDYLDYVREDSEGIVREDLVLSMAERLNSVTEKIEKMGLTILRDENGRYATRLGRNLKINGENIKPILAREVRSRENIGIIESAFALDYMVEGGRVTGLFAFSRTSETLYAIRSKATICATGGASGIYRPNNPGFSRHKMWYSPFNTGAGYAMGIRAGAEMTTFEMRFIALRCKDTIAPTGTLAGGVGASQMNSRGDVYDFKYGAPKTHLRVFSTVEENRTGNGPCYLKTTGITREAEEGLYKAYLNMAPSQTLKWIDSGEGPSERNVEIEGTEPYIVGGHAGSGYWVDSSRETTLKGLYAAGDVAGGSPQKYVTGCFAEAEISSLAALDHIKDVELAEYDRAAVESKAREIEGLLGNPDPGYTADDLEEEMQECMDRHAGGISRNYGYSADELAKADTIIGELLEKSKRLSPEGPYGLMKAYELIDRLYVAKVLVRHLEGRRERRWRSFQENLDFSRRDDGNFLKYINSRYIDGEVEIIHRPLVRKDESYEH